MKTVWIGEVVKKVKTGTGLNEALFYVYGGGNSTPPPLSFETAGIYLMEAGFAPYGAAPLFVCMAERGLLDNPVSVKVCEGLELHLLDSLDLLFPEEVKAEVHKYGNVFRFPCGISAGWTVAILRGWGWLLTTHQRLVEDFLYSIGWEAKRAVLKDRALYVHKSPEKFAAFLQMEVE